MKERNPTEKDLEYIHELLNTFLMRNGGSPNGYQTAVQGYVKTDTFGELKLILPQMDDLTGKRLRAMGKNAYEMVRSYLERSGIKNRIDIKPVATNMGYRLQVSWTLTVEKDFHA